MILLMFMHTLFKLHTINIVKKRIHILFNQRNKSFLFFVRKYVIFEVKTMIHGYTRVGIRTHVDRYSSKTSQTTNK